MKQSVEDFLWPCVSTRFYYGSACFNIGQAKQIIAEASYMELKRNQSKRSWNVPWNMYMTFCNLGLITDRRDPKLEIPDRDLGAIILSQT